MLLNASEARKTIAAPAPRRSHGLLARIAHHRDRGGESPDALAPRVAAAMINVALRVAAEEYARKRERTDRTLDEVARDALRIAAEALRQGPGSGEGPGAAGR